MKSELLNTEIQRCHITVKGVVQGVGFRPFVYRVAKELNLSGWVNNTTEGVIIEVEGKEANLEEFLKRIAREAPTHSKIDSLQSQYLKPKSYQDFNIRHSESSADKTTLVLPDMATCPECLEEIFDSRNRRHLYPFTNCTHCGPRYSIIEAIPYDRKNTSMKIFTMCAGCQREYDDPNDRRFHARPNACPQCGPHLELWNAEGGILEMHHNALMMAAQAVKNGKIVAVKGIGGFHLFCDARDDASVERLRVRKHREGKPLALMFRAYGMIELVCAVSDLEKSLLTSSEAPIVLLKKRKDCRFIAEAVAPDNPYLGAMLPYSPLHHILMRELQIPLVATSGNISDEPICTDEKEALKRLSGIADCFLVHNRPIVRSVDDSVVRIMMDRPLILRRSRGFAPLPVAIAEECPTCLSVGGHLKNTVAVNVRNHVFLSQYIGDLETPQSYEAFRQTAKSLQGLYEASPAYVVHDAHPDYVSTQFAKQSGLPLIEVQHHHAHIAACMAENHLQGKVLGISWDGTGWGPDKTIWGGEFLLADSKDFQRIGHVRPFPLPGGEQAVKEPRRTALGVLSQLEQPLKKWQNLPVCQSFTAAQLAVMERMLSQGLNCPLTSSVGRLFDAVASLSGLCPYNRYEGEAAMALEFILPDGEIDDHYEFEITLMKQNVFVMDWAKMIKGILNDIQAGIASQVISAKFHNALAEMAVEMAKKAGERNVILSGGCFQNKYLTERLITRLRQEGFTPHWHQWVPPNDGGIALGQMAVALNSRF